MPASRERFFFLTILYKRVNSLNSGDNYRNCLSLLSPADQAAFSTCPAQYFLTNLLLSAQSGHTIPSSNHSRVDLPRYSFVGRSYGAGASVGLTDTSFRQVSDDILTYNFSQAAF